MNFKIIFTKYDLLFLEYILTRFMNGVFINKNMILNSFNSKKKWCEMFVLKLSGIQNYLKLILVYF